MNATSITPCLAYDNAEKAIKWLCDAFGFTEKLIVPTESRKIAHAELMLGQCMVMVGSSDSVSEFSKLTKQPGETGGYVTQSPYIVLDDEQIEGHYKQAKNHGAKIAIELRSEDYGGKQYACYDPEGHLWNFGSYDPFEPDLKVLEEEVKSTENQWIRFIEKNDIEGMEQFMKDVWSLVGTNGITSKEQFLNAVKSGDLIHTKMDFETKSVKIVGNTATITQLGTSEGSYKGKPFSFYEWSTSVLIKNNGKWKALITTLVPAG